MGSRIPAGIAKNYYDNKSPGIPPSQVVGLRDRVVWHLSNQTSDWRIVITIKSNSRTFTNHSIPSQTSIIWVISIWNHLAISLISHCWINEILEKIERKFCNVECLQAVLSLLKLFYGLSKQHIFVFRRYLWTCTVVSQIPWLYKQVGYRGFYFKFTRGHTCIWGKKCYGRSYHQPAFCDLVETLVLKTQNVGFWYDLP